MMPRWAAFAYMFGACAMFFAAGAVAVAFGSGADANAALGSLFGSTAGIGMLALAIMAAAVVSNYVQNIAERVDGALSHLSLAIHKIGGDGRREGSVEEEISHAAETLLKMKAELEEARKSCDNAGKNAKYIAQTEQALLNILEDVEEANRKLKELDQLKTDFLNVTSHELRTPLTPIIAYVDMLEKGKLGPVSPEQVKALDAIGRNASRLKLLISDILDIAKLEGRRMKYVMEQHDVERIISSAAQDQMAYAKNRGVRVAVEKMPKIPKLKVDGSRITQVVSNLINNAIKFSEPGSEVKVRVALTPKEVIVSVSDKGMGIPPEDVSKLFNMFYQSRRTMTRNAEGTGLGLAICRWIIQDHGGKIWAASKVGKGSTFSFSLPRRFSPKTDNIVEDILQTATADEVVRDLERKAANEWRRGNV